MSLAAASCATVKPFAREMAHRLSPGLHHVGMGRAGGKPGGPGADQQRQAGGGDGEPPGARAPAWVANGGSSGSQTVTDAAQEGN